MEMGPGPASLQPKMPPHLAELSVPQSHKDRTAAPVQDTDGAWTPASNERVKGLGLGFKCPPSRTLPNVGPVGEERGQDQGREEGLGQPVPSQE